MKRGKQKGGSAQRIMNAEKLFDFPVKSNVGIFKWIKLVLKAAICHESMKICKSSVYP